MDFANTVMVDPPPKLFVSYSHDNEAHKAWVLTLAHRLRSNYVDVILDRWELTIGADLPRFMESGLTEAKRVLVICTDPYVRKANEGCGGVGYEKMILTAQLMRNTSDDRIIPVVRSGGATPPVPTFLSSRLFIDFRDDRVYEAKYEELLRDIHRHPIQPRPPIGPNPLTIATPDLPPVIRFGPERYTSPSMAGKVTFDYSNNNGRYTFGTGDKAFETAWSRGGTSRIHAYTDPPSIRSIAIAVGAKTIEEISDARLYDTSSRVRRPYLGEVVVWQNTAGYFLATKILTIGVRGTDTGADELTVEYKIAPNKFSSFAP